VEKLVRLHVKSGEELHQRRQPNLADAALYARNLHRRESRAMGEVFLRPPLRLARGSDVLAKALDRSIHALDRPGA
jgi:hypothetical protein